MEEERLRRLLLAVGVLAFLGSVVSAWQAMPLLQDAFSPVFTSLLCSPANGTAVFSQPTSSNFCSKYGSQLGKVSSNWCMFYPDAKTGTCQKLVDVLEDRSADCFVYRLGKQTDYAQGAPQVNEYCRVLQAR
ncbi:hypothetical protein HYV43_01910 [Candidatus Micrarchaeota archaeon]|nr:hypothetical protein [Candidatus Micrarchaeota archaeon]